MYLYSFSHSRPAHPSRLFLSLFFVLVLLLTLLSFVYIHTRNVLIDTNKYVPPILYTNECGGVNVYGVVLLLSHMYKCAKSNGAREGERA